MDKYQPQFKLNVGDLFPLSSLKNQNGTEINVNDFSSEYTVLFFYPKDNTPTCTKEACGIRDNYSLLKEHHCEIFGVSPDDVKSHQKFIKKFDLNYDLLVDEHHELASALGIWGPKLMFGLEYEGLHRVSYVLNKSKHIHKIIYPVESGIHTQQILDSIQ